ncbi:MAG: secretin N-terminal domain-containing protein [Candidatus Margulisiibacteriota bacterium]|nr:secretin and TonB N-terminal domain-containing protein [Candidatus Margulisiibacteriota bacterium]
MKKIILLLVVLVFMTVNVVGAADIKVSQGKLSFTVKEADVRSILPIFAKYLKKNIVAGDDVKGNVSLSFTDVTPQEGLEAVLRSRGLDWYDQGNTIVVSSKKQVRTFVLEFASATDVANALNLIAEDGDSISVDPAYNALVIKAASDNMARLRNSINELDVPPLQVMVETKIIEVRNAEGGALGMDIKYVRPEDSNDFVQTKGLSGRAGDENALGVYAQVITTNLEAYLSAIEATVGYNLVAAPRLSTLNHKKAYILIGSKIGFKTAVITDTGTVQQVHFMETGTSLEFTPHISDTGYIRMEIYPKISEAISTSTSGDTADTIPSENTTESKNEVLVKDGETVVIGGLIKHSEEEKDTGVPFLMSIPYIGGLFRTTQIVKEKRELLVFVTPRIITPEYLNKLQQETGDVIEREKKEGADFLH